MKRLLLSLAAASLLFASCDKNDDDDDYVSNTWTVNGTVHQVVNSGRLIGNTNIFVNEGNGHGLTFVFAGAPVSGNYVVVDYPTQPGEVGIIAQEGSLQDIYRSTSSVNEGSTVSVGVDGNNATIYTAGANLIGLLQGAGNVTVTASIREQN